MTEALIKERFRQSFDADLRALMPHLFTMKSADDKMRCALGLREAPCHRLYMNSISTDRWKMRSPRWRDMLSIGLMSSKSAISRLCRETPTR
ncbi:thermostable hemolysin [Dongia sp.]|uniref:thermostable hemolysin n=1 Tax=Dongia sp. TaxID=1977262 RepID=UPI0035B3B096